MIVSGLKKHSMGFSLLEVLITLIVLGMGLISLAMFQGAAIKDSSLAKERSVAVYLAQQKIEDLRNFAALQTPNPNPLGFVAYTTIATNSGGQLGASTFTPPDSNVPYTLSWAVRDWYYPVMRNSGPSTTPPAINPLPPPDVKEVVVSISWPDRNNNLPPPPACTLPLVAATYDTRVCLTTFINATDPSR